MIIIGIDPGSRVAGFSVIERVKESGATPRDYRILDAGVLKFEKKLSWTERLTTAASAIDALSKEWKPSICVFERSFYGDNVRTAIQLGEVRGAMISAAGRCGAQIGEITPAEVKKIIAGNGRANKEEVATAIQALYNIEIGELPFDVTDAVAIAVSYSMTTTPQF